MDLNLLPLFAPDYVFGAPDSDDDDWDDDLDDAADWDDDLDDDWDEEDLDGEAADYDEEEDEDDPGLEARFRGVLREKSDPIRKRPQRDD